MRSTVEYSGRINYVPKKALLLSRRTSLKKALKNWSCRISGTNAAYYSRIRSKAIIVNQLPILRRRLHKEGNSKCATLSTVWHSLLVVESMKQESSDSTECLQPLQLMTLFCNHTQTELQFFVSVKYANCSRFGLSIGIFSHSASIGCIPRPGSDLRVNMVKTWLLGEIAYDNFNKSSLSSNGTLLSKLIGEGEQEEESAVKVQQLPVIVVWSCTFWETS